MSHYSENIIIGAGAAGLFCAAQLGKLSKQATIFDNGKKIGRKILMSGGGFCNFTNMEITSGRYISQNKHFVKSALKTLYTMGLHCFSRRIRHSLPRKRIRSVIL